MSKQKQTNKTKGLSGSKKKNQQQLQKQQKITQFYQANPKKEPQFKPKKKKHSNQSATKKVRQLQTTLTGLTTPKSDHQVGDQPTHKQPNHVRIANTNCNNLPAEAYKHKGKQLMRGINHHKIDINIGQEHGLIPTLLDAHDALEEQITDIHNGKATTAHNAWEKRTEKYLAGGTMIITTKEAAHRTISTSVEPSKMG